MSFENPNPNPEMYVIPTVMTSELEEARIAKDQFQNEVLAEQKAAGFIDVQDVPSNGERIEVKHVSATEQVLGGRALTAANRETVTTTEPTPQQMRNAIGTPYYQDEAGRIVPRDQ